MPGDPIPSIGRIVHLRLDEACARDINRRYEDAAAKRPAAQEERPGWQAHFGNRVSAGEVVPMIITKAWSGDCVNGQVLLDGNDSLWATSVVKGDEPGQWNWPPRV